MHYQDKGVTAAAAKWPLQSGPLMRETHLGKSTVAKRFAIKKHNNKYLSHDDEEAEPRKRSSGDAYVCNATPPAAEQAYVWLCVCVCVGSKCRKTNVKWNCFCRCPRPVGSTPHKWTAHNGCLCLCVCVLVCVCEWVYSNVCACARRQTDAETDVKSAVINAPPPFM